MKKIIFVLFALLSVSVYAENLTGFWGVEFGSSKDEVEQMMKNRGWTIKNSSASEVTYTMKDAKYAGLNAGDITFTFNEERFSNTTVVISMTKTEKIQDVAEALIDKYDLSLVKTESSYIQGMPCKISMYISSNGNTFGYTLISVSDNSIAMFNFISSTDVLNMTEKEKAKKREAMKDDL